MKLSSNLIRTAIATALLAAGAGATALAQDARIERGERGWGGGAPIDVATMEQRTIDRAAAMDADGDGVITAEEVIAYRDARRLVREQRRLQRLDADDDGVVSVEEYAAARIERIERLDADGDGQVTREEMRAARDGMRGMGRGHRGGTRGR